MKSTLCEGISRIIWMQSPCVMVLVSCWIEVCACMVLISLWSRSDLSGHNPEGRERWLLPRLAGCFFGGTFRGSRKPTGRFAASRYFQIGD